MDKIIIEDLLLPCIVGINPEERLTKQEVNLRVTLFTDLQKSGRTDCIDDTVDYKTLKVKLRQFIEPSSFLLIEKLATEVAKICLLDKRVEKVNVRIEKPGALRFARTVAVEIERQSGDFAEMTEEVQS